MAIDTKRQKFVEKAQKYFDFLTSEYGYKFVGCNKLDWKDELRYENEEIDRLIILSNQYHPNDYGFEIQLYRPSISTDHADREFQLYKLKEEQDVEQEYLSELAGQFKANYEAVITGERWIAGNDDSGETDSLKESFERELEKIKTETLLSPEFRRKKTILWGIRTFIALILYIAFWKYDWVKWTLIFYVPLSLFGLLSIYGWHSLLKKKIERTNRKITEAEKAIKESQTE